MANISDISLKQFTYDFSTALYVVQQITHSHRL